MRVFLWNRRYLTSVLSYLAALSWDVAHAESTCSWIELALDFESCMRVMLPPPGELSPKTDQLGLNTATLAARGSTLPACTVPSSACLISNLLTTPKFRSASLCGHSPSLDSPDLLELVQDPFCLPLPTCTRCWFNAVSVHAQKLQLGQPNVPKTAGYYLRICAAKRWTSPHVVSTFWILPIVLPSKRIVCCVRPLFGLSLMAKL